MSTPAVTTEGRAGVPPLTRPETGLAGVGALAAAGVGALGLISSFDAVSAAAATWGFSSPWMLPIGIDLAIPVFTVANLLLIRMDMPLAWVRFVPWILTLITCGLNVSAGTGLTAKVAHGTMPLLWVVFSEIGAHIYSVRIGAATGHRMEKIRRSRWLLAPISTFALWRRMTLWEITSYPQALILERERVLTRAALRERHGRSWRSRTPRTERVLLKLGESLPAAEQTTPTREPVAPAPAPQSAPVLPDAPSAPKPPAATPRPKPRARAKGKPKPRALAVVLKEAREETTEWPDSALTAEALRSHLHCSVTAARAARDTLLNERAARPDADNTPAPNDGPDAGDSPEAARPEREAVAA